MVFDLFGLLLVSCFVTITHRMILKLGALIVTMSVYAFLCFLSYFMCCSASDALAWSCLLLHISTNCFEVINLSAPSIFCTCCALPWRMGHLPEVADVSLGVLGVAFAAASDSSYLVWFIDVVSHWLW